ncbi:class I SAM-dependent methyltransferase [Sphingosinicella sp. CPCC 101087]|uniref:class I SAM-dependent methyltransferase n=1 Tax=Sphingosinicella sp. CPCC 101087 TaxID=2497754 RepID=UPI00101C9585|nr:class I SAM-dependent methyltransferase [Sphingosinicella sp. CPCC 101087]
MSRDPWAAYWAKADGARSESGCLPEADRSVAPILETLWREFAGTLRGKARVLDLATGGGAVLRRLAAARKGLTLVGVDSAPALPAGPAGIRLIADVRMEALPFGDASFDAVTSQFGIEYGDRARIAGETARVLAPGGRVRLVVHDRASLIVRHNEARLRALDWASKESGILDKARGLARARALSPLPTPESFRAATSEARRLFPEQPVAAEFAMAVLQTLEQGRGRPARETIEVLDTLAARAADEAGRIAALLEAACDEGAAAAIGDRLKEAGLELDRLSAISERPGRALAWLIDASRR